MVGEAQFSSEQGLSGAGRLRKGVGRAGIDATTASAATVRHWRVGGELDVDEELAEEEHATGMRNNELMVAAYPAEARPHCPVAFKYGCGVAEWLSDGRGVSCVCCLIVLVLLLFILPVSRYKSGKLTEFLLHDVMIVMAVGVGCNLVLVIVNSAGRCIAECYSDDVFRAWYEKTRVKAFVEVVFEVVHIGMAAVL